MRSLLPLLGVSLISSTLTLVGAVLVLAPASRAEPAPQTLPALQAQRFEVVDAAGTVRARFGADPDGTTGLSVLDPQGQPRITLSLTPADLAVVQVRNAQGANANVTAQPGSVGVGMVDPAGASRAGMGLSQDGSPVIEIGSRLQEQPNPRLQLSELPDGTLGLGIADRTGRPRVGLATAPDGTPGLALLDSSGRPRLLVSMQGDGTPVLRLQNDQGQVTWSPPQ